MQKHYHYIEWSQAKTIKKNGRFSSFIYFALQSRRDQAKLAKYKERSLEIDKLLFQTDQLLQKPNIYIVVLESFIDPRLIKDATFSPSPLAPELKAYLYNSDFSHTISPVYGGGTAQAEFEILTAAKAFAKIHSVDFNTLGGESIDGFVSLLKHNGYSTVATIATYSGYYNSQAAYTSIGFDDIRFLEDRDDFQKSEGDKKIFDGDLYKYNIRLLETALKKEPYLLYSLGMYGHFPYARNLAQRPQRITTTHPDARVERIANQFFYRTKALASYIKDILEKDPHSVIFVSSDHIPPILDKNIEYKLDKFQNISLLLIDGKPVDISGYHYYEIPQVIVSILNRKKPQNRQLSKRQEEEIYFKILSESLNTK